MTTSRLAQQLAEHDQEHPPEPVITPPPQPQPQARGPLYAYKPACLTCGSKAPKLWKRAWSLLVALTGGLVDTSVAERRNAVCGTCTSRVVPLKQRRGVVYEANSYCAQCKCPKWFLSRLSIKNRLRKHSCPLRLHPGPYPDDVFREYVRAKQEENAERAARDVQLPVAGGNANGRSA